MRRTALILLLALAAGACAPEPVPVHEVKATLTFSEVDRFYESGNLPRVEATLFNRTESPIVAGPGLMTGERLELQGPAGPVETRPMRVALEPQVIPGRERARFDLQLQDLFPENASPGIYRLTAVYPLFRSNTIEINVIPPFEPDARYTADLVTDAGTITLRLFSDLAPGHVRNFVNLARSSYYDGTVFHRIVRGQFIQGGDPEQTGRGGPGYAIAAELNDRPHRKGTLSMARGDRLDSAGSQFFICLDRIPDLDGQYTVFGEVESGIEVAEAIGRSRVRMEVPVHLTTVQRVVVHQAAGD